MLTIARCAERLARLVPMTMATIGLGLSVAASVQASYESERAVIEFFVAWNKGQDCKTLFTLRAEAMKLGATDAHERYMHQKLIAAGCTRPTVSREPSKSARPSK
jgi:hypothetical protein